VTKQLPHNGREFEYRIKSSSEEHERVAGESELNRSRCSGARRRRGRSRRGRSSPLASGFARLRSTCFDPGISPQYARSRLCGRPKSSIEYRWAANSDEQMALLAVDLVRKGVDLIVTAGTPATVAAKQATTTIPIVFAVAGAPLEKGLVDSLAHPGGNVTGLALIMDVVKALEILKEAAPRVSRVAFIYDPSTVPGRFEEGWLNRVRARSRTPQVDLQPVILQKPHEIDRCLQPSRSAPMPFSSITQRIPS
jgi:ABC transporter substrate binding protein